MEDALDTFPRLLLHHASVRPEHPAAREKDLGIWQTTTWSGVGAGGPRPCVRTRRAGLQARHASGDHRRQPAAPVLVDDGRAGAGRRSRADVPGRARGRHRVRAEQRGDRLRAGRGPGTGRQAAGGASRRSPSLAPHLLRRPARPAQLRSGHELRPPARNRPRIRPRESGILRRGNRARRHPRRRRSCSTRPARRASPKGVCQTHAAFIAAARGGIAVRQADGRREHPVVPADGVGRRQPLLLRAGDGRRLHDQLPGIGRYGDDRHARDRPDVLLRAAARVREPVDAGDDPHGGRKPRQARAVPPLHRRGAPLRRDDPRRQAGSCRRPPAVCARQSAGLRTAAQRARHEPHSRRVHGRRGHRPRPLPLLPLDRHQPEAALRLDRNLRLRLPAAGPRRQVRHRGHCRRPASK